MAAFILNETLETPSFDQLTYRFGERGGDHELKASTKTIGTEAEYSKQSTPHNSDESQPPAKKRRRKKNRVKF